MKDHNSRLKTLFERLTAPHGDFVAGDLVRWKDGLLNANGVVGGEVVIVTEVLSCPIFDPENSTSSPYFREPITIKIGLVDNDGHFVEYHMDGRRFEKVPESEL